LYYFVKILKDHFGLRLLFKKYEFTGEKDRDGNYL